MTQTLPILVSVSIASTALGGVISYEEQEYETVNWIISPEAGSGISGNVGDISVGFSSFMSGDPSQMYDYSSDPAFGGLSFDSSMSEAISFFGGEITASNLTLSEGVDSILLLIGSPNDNSGLTHFGSSLWDFDDDLNIEVIASEGDPGFVVQEGNILANPGWGPGTQVSGAIRISGEAPLTSLEWLQDTLNGVDQLRLSIAVSVPAPASSGALLAGMMVLGRRRR